MRTLRGAAADWTLTEVLLARLEYRLAAIIWQNGGGKGGRPKPIEIPGVGERPQKSRAERGEEAVERLRNLGLIPAPPGQRPGPLPQPGQRPEATTTVAEFQAALEAELARRS